MPCVTWDLRSPTDQGANPHPMRYKADSYTPERRGSPAKESLFIPDPESLQSALQGPGTPTLSSAKGTVALGTHTVHMLDLQANHFIFGRFAFSAAPVYLEAKFQDKVMSINYEDDFGVNHLSLLHLLGPNPRKEGHHLGQSGTLITSMQIPEGKLAGENNLQHK